MRNKLGTLFAIFALATAAPAFADGLTEDIAFNVINNTSEAITAVHLSTSRDPNWGDDIATDVIPAGGTMSVSVTDNMPDCEYDMRLVFADGHSQDYGEVNLCTINGTSVTVN